MQLDDQGHSKNDVEQANTNKSNKKVYFDDANVVNIQYSSGDRIVNKNSNTKNKNTSDKKFQAFLRNRVGKEINQELLVDRY